MSRLHKISKFPLIKKYYILFFILILAGFYKNGIVSFNNEYISFIKMITLILIPILSFLIAWIFDFLFKNQDIFNNRFYSLLFSMIIPINTNIFLYFIILICFLSLNSFFTQKKVDNQLNLIVIFKILLVEMLIVFHSYNYENSLELSGLFKYSFLDNLFGHNVSGIFTSNTILIIISLILLETDDYYKKEIPLYSYGLYILSLLIFSLIKHNMTFLLTNMLSSNILFVLVFIAPLSLFSPVGKKRFLYSIIIGSLILPISLITNFFEGVYISIIITNILMILLNLLTKILVENEKKKNLKQK